jgi:hypothetical protein
MTARKVWLAFLASNPPCGCGDAPRGARCTASGWIRCNERWAALRDWGTADVSQETTAATAAAAVQSDTSNPSGATEAPRSQTCA